MAEERRQLLRCTEAIIEWLESETDFAEWAPAVKQETARMIDYLIEIHFPTPGEEE